MEAAWLILVLGLGVAIASWISGVAPGLWIRGGFVRRSDEPGLFRFIVAAYALTAIIVSLIFGLVNYGHQ